MTINREKIHSLIEIFYQPTFKTFYVNSLNGTNLIKPLGVFVSLGITTSMKVLNDIKSVLEENGYSAIISEISSKKVLGNQFVNTLTNSENPEQYRIPDEELPEDIMTEEEARAELHRMKSMMDPANSELNILMEYAPKISRLQDLIEKLSDSNGWDAHLIQKNNDEYRIYHRYINYHKEGDIEYRIGIYVNNTIDD